MEFASIKEAIDFYLGNKSAFYGFMLRKGFALPEESTTAVTIRFLDLGFRRQIWIPKQTELSYIQLETPPSQDESKALLLNLLETLKADSQPHQ